MTFSDIINSCKLSNENTVTANVPESWMQGRTTYGGLSSALCLQAVIETNKELPPLRSAQINFIGPVGGQVSITTRVLRRGRSVAYISAEMSDVKGLATHAVFCFGASRESRLNGDFTQAPQVPSVDQLETAPPSPYLPKFLQHFEVRIAQGGKPITGSTENENYFWMRYKDNSSATLTDLIGIADMPPPAVLPMFEEPGQLSSMTWMLNFLTEDVNTEDGWWLVRTAAEHARDGYSSQDMQVWNTAGKLVVSAQQSVAIFY